MATFKEFVAFAGAADELQKAQFEALMKLAEEKGFGKEAKAAVGNAAVKVAEANGVKLEEALSADDLKKVAGGTILSPSWWDDNFGKCEHWWSMF